jgi:hypothetical protein
MAKKPSLNSILTSIWQWIASDSIASIAAVIMTIIALLALLFYLLSPSTPHSTIIYGQADETASSNMPKVGPERGDIWESIHERARRAKHVYVIPGGGSGLSADSLEDPSLAYPLWTKQRVQAAYHHYSTVNPSSSVFLALSAGSLNAPNQRSSSTKNIIFECQHIFLHLVDLGVDKDLIFGDIMSWDTVGRLSLSHYYFSLPVFILCMIPGNGLTLRLFLEGLLSTKSAMKSSRSEEQAESPEIDPNAVDEIFVEVFISDFHSERVKHSFEWILDLYPSLISGDNHPIHLRIHSVSSQGVQWKSKEDFEARIDHEMRGVAIIEENAKHVKTFAELFAFLLLGPHRGIRNYLLESYQPSTGGGW